VIRDRFGASERRACKLLKQPRATQRYLPIERDDEKPLVRRIIELASMFGRYGYRMIHGLLRREGWWVNHKRVERIWRQEGLKVPKKQPKRGRLWLNDGSCVRLRAERKDHVWSYDFVQARTRDGRSFRMLTIIDEFTSDVPTYAHHLRRAGYQTCLSGKMHFVGPDQMHGFEQRLTTDIYPADFGWTPDYRKPGERIDWWYHNLGSVTGSGIAETSNQMEYDDEVAHHARAKIYDLARGHNKRPWSLTVSFTHPHDPYVTRKKYWDL